MAARTWTYLTSVYGRSLMMPPSGRPGRVDHPREDTPARSVQFAVGEALHEVVVARQAALVADRPEPRAGEAPIVREGELGRQRRRRIDIDPLPAALDVRIGDRVELDLLDGIEGRREGRVVVSEEVVRRDPGIA